MYTIMNHQNIVDYKYEKYLNKQFQAYSTRDYSDKIEYYGNLKYAGMTDAEFQRTADHLKTQYDKRKENGTDCGLVTQFCNYLKTCTDGVYTISSTTFYNVPDKKLLLSLNEGNEIQDVFLLDLNQMHL